MKWLDSFGPEADAFAKWIDEEAVRADTGLPPRNPRRRYELQHQSHAFSYAFSSAFLGSYYTNLIQMLDRVDLGAPRRILDLGCGNGLMTVYLAQRFPDAQVLGIDCISDALDVAREQALRFNTENVKFMQLELDQLHQFAEDDQFDLITAFLVFADAWPFRSPANHVPVEPRHQDWSYPAAPEDMKRALKHVRGLLANDGQLINAERCPNAYTTCWWLQHLSEARFAIDSLQMLRFHEVEDHQRLPLITCEKDGGGLSTLEIIETVESQSVDSVVNGIRRRTRRKRFRQIDIPGYLAPDVADRMFKSMPIRVLEVEDVEHGAMVRHEIRRQDNLLGVLQMPSTNIPILTVAPESETSRFVHRLDNIASEAPLYGCRILRYNKSELC